MTRMGLSALKILFSAKARVSMVAAGRLLDEDVARPGVLEGVKNQVHGVLDGHHEPRHIGVRDRQGLPRLDLPTKRGSPSPAKPSRCRSACRTGPCPFSPCKRDLATMIFSIMRLGHPHGVDGIDGLVGAEDDHPLDPVPMAADQNVLRAQDVGPRTASRG